jgi:hypothetical protein
MQHTYNVEELGTTNHYSGYYYLGADEKIYMNMASNGTHKDVTVY